jgi:hypothetical protein
MRRVLCLLSCTIALVAPTALAAQSAERKGGPEKGTWGAEAQVGSSTTIGGGVGDGAAVLRFVSPSTALVGGFSFSRTDFQSEMPNPTTVFTAAGFTTVALRAGFRRYAGTGIGLRPVYGAGALFSRNSVFGVSASNNVGGYGEAGAAWFFNPHVSLGVLGGVSAIKLDDGWSVGGTLARLTGAVYF